jgi:hypothetical protein
MTKGILTGRVDNWRSSRCTSCPRPGRCLSFADPGDNRQRDPWAQDCSQDLQTAFACYGMPRNVEEFQNPDGRYIVTFDRSLDGNLIQIAILVTENAARKAESIRLFARPWPVVKLFRQFMERDLRPDPVSDAIWDLPASYP